MLIQPIPVSPWQANCYVVTASEDVAECVVIDPGITGADAIEAAVKARGLTVQAVLATHGHVDHVGDAHRITSRWGVPVYLAAADQHLLTRPGEGLGELGAELMRQITGKSDLPPADDVRDYDEPFEVAGLRVTPTPAPGHTRGSTLLEVASREITVVFTGDVLFAGTIGRTDLPGGDMDQMRATLRHITEHVDPETPLLPGHGQPTTLAREVGTNPYLA